LGKADNRKLLRHISNPPQACIFIAQRHNSKVIKRLQKSTQTTKPPKHPRLPTDRIEYSPITERPPLKLPDGSRMVVWVIVAVEEWDPTQPMPRTVLTPPAGGLPMPDVPNWAWHEYGNRVGFRRFIKVFDEFSILGTICINGLALAAYPQIVRAAVERNWEFVGHGLTQRNMQKVPNERGDICKVREVISRATGKPPRA
jgi:hypothetical protein